MPRLSKQGNPERDLVENNFGTTYVSHGDQSFPQHYYDGNVQVHNYLALLHESNSNAFQTFWPRLYLLHLIDVSWILLDCNFIQQIRLLRSQIFHSTNFTNGAHVIWFPLLVVFVTSTSGRFVKLKPNKIKLYFQEYKRTEFNKTIIPFALVGYEIGYSQLGPTGLVGYLPSHIQRALME